MMELDKSIEQKAGDDVYRAMAYYRLSKEDRHKHESDSIGNQRVLVHEYLKKHPNIELIDEAYDDGYSGTNYDRPGFARVIEAAEDGKINCVIVKDLSRLGREYVETGKYLEMIFPKMGVRFIAINDDVDSMHAKSGDDILIPVKNIMNESYCRELSKKLRRQFKIQRANGEFLGSFACYGYFKDPADKHKLIIDEYAAEIVRMIYALKLKGFSQQAIADYLTKEAVLTPAEYKKSLGLNYQSGFRGGGEAKWHPCTIRQILTNPVYIGTLVQGKRSTPNYKVKKMRLRDESLWDVVRDNHTPIIDEYTFQTVQRIMERDTRKSPQEQTVYALAGMVFCADCGRAMVLRSVSRGNKKFRYYVCSTNKRGQGCSSHSISAEALESAVRHALQNQIKLSVEMKKLLSEVNQGDIVSVKLKRLDILLAEKTKESDKQKDFRLKLYQALHDGLIEREEYDFMREKSAKALEIIEEAIAKLENERKSIIAESTKVFGWLEHFADCAGNDEFARETLLTFIDKITVYENKSINIEFNFHDEMASCREIMHDLKREVS